MIFVMAHLSYRIRCISIVFHLFTLYFFLQNIPSSGDLGSIPSQGEIMNVPVFYHEVNMVLWALFCNVWRVIIMHEP